MEPGKNSWINLDKATKGNKEGPISLPDIPIVLLSGDYLSLAPNTLVLGQVIDTLFFRLATHQFKKGIRTYVLPSSLFDRVSEDLSYETILPGVCQDINFIVSASFYRNHWSLVLIDKSEKKIYYLDPLSVYVPVAKKDKDIKVINRIIWYYLENNDISTEVPSTIENWVVVETSTFEKVNLEKIPKQTGGVDCGIYTVIYISRSSISPEMIWRRSEIGATIS